MLLGRWATNKQQEKSLIPAGPAVLNSFEWKGKPKASLRFYAFYFTDGIDNDVHALDGRIPATDSCPPCARHEIVKWWLMRVAKRSHAQRCVQHSDPNDFKLGTKESLTRDFHVGVRGLELVVEWFPALGTRIFSPPSERLEKGKPGDRFPLSPVEPGTLVAFLQGAWHNRVSVRTTLPGISILWLSEIQNWSQHLSLYCRTHTFMNRSWSVASITALQHVHMCE